MIVIGGLGLNIYEIPIGVIEAIKKSDIIIIEAYTSYNPDFKKIINKCKKNKKIILADRSFIEEKLESFILNNIDKNILILTIGDPLFATTHYSLIVFLKEKNIPYKIIHSSSVFNHIAKIGLFLYKFGKITSIPFHETDTPYFILKENKNIGAHTLFLLDLDPLNKKFLQPKEAINKLLASERKYNLKLLDEDTYIIICSALGTKKEKIIYCKIKNIPDFLDPPFSIVIPGDLNRIEEEYLKYFKI